MSMNLHLTAAGETYPLWQTPTEVTDAILTQKDPYQGYVRWVRNSRSWNWKSPLDVADYAAHKRKLRAWLKAHPDAKWSRW